MRFSTMVMLCEEQRVKFKIPLPDDIMAIYRMFKQNGRELYVVGGAVRDSLLGKTPKDFDLATDAEPDDVLEMAKAEGFDTLEVGKAFGVVLVMGHEIATFRKDIGKGRRPDAVAFTDIRGDVSRRDLTINALFYDIDSQEIVDLVGGIEDLKNKVIRTVGEPNERFDEDPLRKLRALRFASSTGFTLDDSVLVSIKKNPDISGVSPERIKMEFFTGLEKSRDMPFYMKLAEETGLLPQILPGLKIDTNYPETQNIIVLLAYILRGNSVDTVSKVLKQIKYQNNEVAGISFLIQMGAFNPRNILAYKKMQAKSALDPSAINEYGNLIGEDFSKFLSFELSVKGSDLMGSGLKGPEIGKAIANMEYEKYIQQ